MTTSPETISAERASVARPRRRVGGTVLTALTWVIGLIYFLPIAWTVLTSFKTEVQAVTNPPTFLFRPTFDNYRTVLTQGDFLKPFTNSIIATVGSTALVMVLAFPVAYALTVRRVRKANDVLFFFISTRMLPVAGVIIPLYLLVKSIGLLDNVLVLVILYTTMNIPLAIWMLRAYMHDIPKEVVEAARVDGATPLQLVLRIIVPMMRPSLAAAATLCAVFAWSEFFIAVSLTTIDGATLPVYLTGFVTDRGLYWGKLSAIVVLVSIPILLVGTLVQRPLMKGFSIESDK